MIRVSLLRSIIQSRPTSFAGGSGGTATKTSVVAPTPIGLLSPQDLAVKHSLSTPETRGLTTGFALDAHGVKPSLRAG